MPESSLPSRVVDMLLFQGAEADTEIRELSLATMNDDDWLSVCALAWTQCGWFLAMATTGWFWLLGFVVADWGLFALRWKLRRGQTPMPDWFGTPPQRPIVPINIAFFVLVAANILTLMMAPNDRTSIFAIVMGIGFCGYIASVFPAFLVLGMLDMALLCGAMMVGLLFGNSMLARPFAWLIPFGAFSFYFVMRRTHLILIGSLRSQRDHHRLALQDPLTKLPNRAFLRDTLMRHLAKLGTADGPAEVAVLCLDLDGFKTVNDRHGHAAGDWTLIHVAEILRQRLDSDEIACRIGGDEYVLVLPGGSEARVRSLGQGIIEAVAKPFDLGSTVAVRIGVSIGATIARAAESNLDAVLEEADDALYAAKRAGRGRLTFAPRALAPIAA